jgi:apolipoprotein D and lipocalin family protein
MGASSSNESKAPTLEAMKQHLDLPKFMGRWYVIGVIPTVFEKDVHNAIEDYELTTDTAEKKVISVQFTYQTGGFDKKINSLGQKALVHNTDTNAEWRCNPKILGMVVPLNLPYLVLECPDDYSHTVIGMPNRDYLWIMARTPQIKDKLYEDIKLRCQYDYDYDLTNLVKVPQQPLAERGECTETKSTLG